MNGFVDKYKTYDERSAEMMRLFMQIDRHATYPNPLLTIKLVNDQVNNFSHNPSYLRKDPDLSVLGHFVVHLGLNDRDSFFYHAYKEDRGGNPSRLAKAVERALAEITKNGHPNIKQTLFT